MLLIRVKREREREWVQVERNLFIKLNWITTEYFEEY